MNLPLIYQLPQNLDPLYFSTELAFKEKVIPYIIQKLNSEKIVFNPYSIGIPDVHSDGQWCINFEQGLYAVYQNERGTRYRLAIFQSPWDAAEYFIMQMNL